MGRRAGLYVMGTEHFQNALLPIRRDAESGKAEKPKNRVLCPPDPKSALKERGILACGLARRLWIYTQFCALQERGNR